MLWLSKSETKACWWVNTGKTRQNVVMLQEPLTFYVYMNIFYC